jgi:hypothetical protein
MLKIDKRSKTISTIALSAITLAIFYLVLISLSILFK